MTSIEYEPDHLTEHNGRRGSRTAAGPEYKRSLLSDPRKRALAAAELDARREYYEGKAGDESSAENASHGVIADMLGDLVTELRS